MLKNFSCLLRALLLTLVPTFFGCSPNGQTGEPTPTPTPTVEQSSVSEMGDIALLENEADRAAAIRQGICAVSGEPLGSMGKPIKLDVQGREVFICCSGCEDSLRENPQKYFEKLDTRQQPTE